MDDNSIITLDSVIQKALEEVDSLSPDNPEAYALAVRNLNTLQELKMAQDKLTLEQSESEIRNLAQFHEMALNEKRAESEELDRKKDRRLRFGELILKSCQLLGVIGLTLWQGSRTDFWKKAALIFEENGVFTPPTREIMREKFPNIFKF